MIKNLFSFFADPLKRSIGFGFLTMSMLFGTWVSRIPDVQRNLGLTEPQLGFGLLGMSIGALLVTFLAGNIINRIGGSKSNLIGIFGMAITLLPLILASNLWTLFLALFVFGGLNAFLNISLNNSAAELERQEKRPIMSMIHAMYSIGAMVGGGIGGIFLSLNTSPFFHFTIIISFIIIGGIFTRKSFEQLPEAKAEGQGFVVPTWAVIGLMIIGLSAMMGEGVIADWSAIYMELERNISPHLGPFAYTAMAAMMAFGRLFGDQLTAKFGYKKILAYCSLIAALGLCIAIFSSGAVFVISGFGITGLGYSIIVPIVFSQAANIPGIKPSSGIAMIAGAGVIGFLGAPPIIGFLSEYLSLATGFGIIASVSILSFFIVVLKK